MDSGDPAQPPGGFADVQRDRRGCAGALTKRLSELIRVGLVAKQPKPDGHGFFYRPTPAGQATEQVLAAIASWADRWVEVRPEHSDVGLVLSTWCRTSLQHGRLPDRRVVVRFEFDQRGRHIWAWMLVQDGTAEICNFDPGFGDDLCVTVTDAVIFTRWHLGLVSWAQVLRSGAVTLTGPRALRRALPTWNAAPDEAVRRRAAERSMPRPHRAVG